MQIVIDGKKYELIPIEEETSSVLEDYRVSNIPYGGEREVKAQDSAPKPQAGGVRDAIPVVSDYRERYKEHKIKISEVTAPPKRYSKIDRASSTLDDYEYNGEKLFVGEGLREE